MALESSIGTLAHVLATLSIPADVSGKAAEGDPRAWVPVTHKGDVDRVPSFWLWLGTLDVVTIWDVNR